MHLRILDSGLNRLVSIVKSVHREAEKKSEDQLLEINEDIQV
jgi:hypothetical protein